MNYTYTPSEFVPGAGDLLRQHGFTRWMSRDLLQPATDFLKNLGLLAIYAECSSENLHRYLCWHPPEGWGGEIRSGRTLAQFEDYDWGNIARDWPLLSLHINENNLYSAVWVSPNIYDPARKVLAAHGITAAVRTPLT